MAFPLVRDRTSSRYEGGTTSHVVSLPAGRKTNDLLVVFFSQEGAASIDWPSGWTEIADVSHSGGNVRFAVAYRVADGTEGSTITVTSGGTQDSCHIAYAITKYLAPATQAPEIATATGASATPDPPSLTPTGGAKDYLWLAAEANDDSSSLASAAPTNFVNLLSLGVTVIGTAVGAAQRQLNASSQDPGTFTLPASEDWIAATVAIHPGSEGSDIDEVVRITTDMGSATTVDVPVAIADVTKTFTLTAVRSSSDSTGTSTKVTCDIINNGQTMRLQRAGTSTGVTVETQLVTSQNIVVERGALTTTNLASDTSSFDRTITDVGNINKAFALLTIRGTATAANYMRQQWAAKLTSATNLNVSRGVTGATSEGIYQVIRFTDDTTVQHGTAEIASGSSSAQFDNTDVAADDSFAVMSWKGSTARQDLMPRLDITVSGSDITVIDAVRVGTTGTTTAEIMLITLPSTAKVQRHSITDIGNPTNQTITAVDNMARTFTYLTNSSNGTDTIFRRFLTTSKLTSTTNVECRVADTAATLAGRLQTIELPTVAAVFTYKDLRRTVRQAVKRASEW